MRKMVVRFMAVIMTAVLFVPAGAREIEAEAAVRAVSVAGGTAHGLAAWSDGTVTGWGYNKFGQVGDGTTIDQYIPRKISGLTDIVQVAAGANNSFALSAAGEVWGWGSTYGTYTSLDPLSPVQRTRPFKLEGLQNVVSIVTNSYTGLAIKKDGTATMWYPSFESADNSPMRMIVRYLPLPGVSRIKSAVIAGNDALFLTGDGAVKQLSIYNSVYGRVRWASDPLTVNTLADSGIRQIAASGDNDAFLLRTDGQVLRWNRTLQTPSAVSGLGSSYKLQTGSNKLFVVKMNGTLWQWNYNAGGAAKPFQIPNAQSITEVWGTTGTFGFAQRKDGTLLGWGEGFYGGLATGSGTVTNDNTIAAVPVQQPLQYSVNGQAVDFYGTSAVVGGKLYVPYTSVFKALGVKANMSLSNPDPKYNNYRFTVWSFVYGDTTVHIKTTDPAQLFINGKKSGQAVTLHNYSDTTLFPLQQLAELLGIRVNWNPATGEVRLEG
ncbi:hypothetical protein [Paenibacillus sp. DMB5]|uniref:stalk domain-containing protein n=1 Tax=Paenibacillus sp. DMB5 TaxID=1780103 RepID=UPI00076CC8AF|nr:hypothetical protein [Paenibacillus sp. DMB5]KUP23175.1 hypothetical protein AWJ19_21595 [Paenibacillus sp. DMB5]